MTPEELQQLPIGALLLVGTSCYWVVTEHFPECLVVIQDISGWPDPAWRLEMWGLRRYIDRNSRYEELAHLPVRRLA